MRNRGERGSNLIEMALVVPFLLLLLVGVADLGRAFHSQIAITNAAREGVRRGIQLPSPLLSGSLAQIEATVRREVSNYGVDPSLITIAVDTPGNSIVVTTSYPVHLILGGIIGLSEDLVVRSSAEMLWLVGA